MMKKRAHVIIHGQVQGVFFRSETKQRADQANVYGWVKNLRDETVEAVFEGEEEAVEKLIDFCRRGPKNASVNHIDLSYEKFTGEFKGFRVE
jgi:acylphosphatase